jgi:hypothetical protein
MPAQGHPTSITLTPTGPAQVVRPPPGWAKCVPWPSFGAPKFKVGDRLRDNGSPCLGEGLVVWWMATDWSDEYIYRVEDPASNDWVEGIESGFALVPSPADTLTTGRCPAPPPFKVGDRVRWVSGLGKCEGTIAELGDDYHTIAAVNADAFALCRRWRVLASMLSLAEDTPAAAPVRCPDCNGTRVYADGFHAPEPCRLCKGSGTV